MATVYTVLMESFGLDTWGDTHTICVEKCFFDLDEANAYAMRKAEEEFRCGYNNTAHAEWMYEPDIFNPALGGIKIVNCCNDCVRFFVDEAEISVPR